MYACEPEECANDHVVPWVPWIIWGSWRACMETGTERSQIAITNQTYALKIPRVDEDDSDDARSSRA